MNYELGIMNNRSGYVFIAIIKHFCIVLMLLFVMESLFAQNISYIPLEVGEHWSRRSVTEENESNRYYYRPHRFEWMEMEVPSGDCELRAVLTERATSVDIFVKIGNAEQKHTLKVIRNDDYFYYAEPLKINIPSGTSSFFVRTRNPFTYFRHYEVRIRTPRPPSSYTLTPEAFVTKYDLTSPNGTSEYFSGNDEAPIVYRTDADGDVYFFVRSVREGRQGATIDILINGTLHQTVILSHKTSSDYKASIASMPSSPPLEKRVSTGTRIDLPNLKAGDTITILPKSWHEIIVRMIVRPQTSNNRH